MWNSMQEQWIHENDKVTLRMIQSLVQVEPVIYDKTYESRVLKVIREDCFKLAMPVEYGESVPLPLDRIYEIRFYTEDDNYISYGRVSQRYRDEDGDVMIFDLTESLAVLTQRRFLSAVKDLQAKYSLQDSKETRSGTITQISVDHLVLQGPEYIEDHSKLDVVFTIPPGRDIVMAGEVVETLRLRGGEFESHIQVDDMDIGQQKQLAAWILKQI